MGILLGRRPTLRALAHLPLGRECANCSVRGSFFGYGILTLCTGQLIDFAQASISQ